MATNRSGHRPGGGIASRQHVEIGVRTGSGSRGVRESGAAGIGLKYGSHVRGQSDTGYRVAMKARAAVGLDAHSTVKLGPKVRMGNRRAAIRNRNRATSSANTDQTAEGARSWARPN